MSLRRGADPRRAQPVYRRLRRLLLAGALALAGGAALADSLDDDFNTVWEILWDQRGTPRRVSRWEEGSLRFRVGGPEAREHRERLAQAMVAAGAATGLSVTDVTDQADLPAQVEFQVLGDGELSNNEPCVTFSKTRSNYAMEKATVKIRRKDGWRCAFHEVMHVMGIHGHPTGRTVLSYISRRREDFQDLDLVMLRAWYAPALSQGATPLEAVATLTEAVASQSTQPPADEARRRARVFVAQRVEQLKALANGTGGVPAIILRSGKASEAHMRNAAREAAYFLGLAYQRGTGVDKDEAQAAPWFKQAAEAGHAASQVLWGRALATGRGVPADPLVAYAWLARAARAGNNAGKPDMEKLERTLSPTQLEQARATAAAAPLVSQVEP